MKNQSLELTPEKVRDYEACARYYDFKYNDEIRIRSNNRSVKTEEFLNTIYKVASFYVYKRQAYEDPSLTSLLNRWQKDWYGDTTAVDILKMQNSVQQNSKTAYSTRAIESLKLFYDHFKDINGPDIFWLNDDFVVPVTDQKLPLKGKADLVIRKEDKKEFHVYKFGHSTLPPEEWKYDILSTGLALKHSYDISEYKIRYFIWSFMGNALGAKEMLLEKKDYDLLNYWVEEISKDKIFVSRYGFVTLCKNCPFKSKCLNWQFPKEES